MRFPTATKGVSIEYWAIISRLPVGKVREFRNRRLGYDSPDPVNTHFIAAIGEQLFKMETSKKVIVL
jgi:hypothetical protein